MIIITVAIQIIIKIFNNNNNNNNHNNGRQEKKAINKVSKNAKVNKRIHGMGINNNSKTKLDNENIITQHNSHIDSHKST